MKKPGKTANVQKSSGNVFRDLGLSNPNERLAKAQLAHRICEIIAQRNLNQTEAAALMGIDQPKISALKQGRLAGFSVERLFRCLNELGQEVKITIQPARQGAHRGETSILFP
ncbi:MAG TPA: helix-turn-helix transcriptional regulator [Pirellulales bacterium]